jgi:hypothetical protein
MTYILDSSLKLELSQKQAFFQMRIAQSSEMVNA